VKLMVLGYARHGKDTVCEMLREMYGLTFMSSSLAAAEIVMMPIFGDKYKTVQECFDDRVNHRSTWYDGIRAFNAKDPTKLMRLIYDKVDVYSGIRSWREFTAGRNTLLFHHAIWVDRSELLPPEPTSSNTMEKWMADFIIDNNGTLEELRRNVRQLMETRLGQIPLGVEQRSAE
jgi:hypothetical protein